LRSPIWLNGKLSEASVAVLHVSERGFLFGDGLMETLRIYDGRPWAMAEHRQRLAAGCAALGIDCPLAEIDTGLATLLSAAGLGEGSARITVTRGQALRRGLLGTPGVSPTLLITAVPGQPYHAEAYQCGFQAVTVSFPRNQHSPIVNLKTLNCLENILGRNEAQVAGADEGIFNNLDGELAEGTVSNLFLVYQEGRLVTPPVACGLLPGIARQNVLELAPEIGLEACEEVIRPGNLGQAGEAFLTNSLMEVMPLVSLDGIKIGSGRPGPVARHLRQAYLNLVHHHVT
jgi:branched-chain amino acid aminotransferase